MRGYLAAHERELRDIDPDLAAFVCVSSVETSGHRGAVNALVD